jgi:hypothetical protein
MKHKKPSRRKIHKAPQHYKFIAEPALFWAGYFLKKVKIFPSERNSFLNLSAPVLNFSGDEGKIFTFKPAQKVQDQR